MPVDERLELEWRAYFRARFPAWPELHVRARAKQAARALNEPPPRVSAPDAPIVHLTTAQFLRLVGWALSLVGGPFMGTYGAIFKVALNVAIAAAVGYQATNSWEGAVAAGASALAALFQRRPQDAKE